MALLVLIGAGTPALGQVYGEAPSLAAQVAVHALPPVDQRLPDNPVLIEPAETLGQYGGTWHMVMRTSRDHASLLRTLGYENLVRWNPDWTAVIPNVAQSWSVNEDASEFTFVLRRGMRWSDGAPFTADDILFWYEDVLLDPALTPAVPQWLQVAGKPPRVEKIDDVTIRFRFAKPNALFLQFLAAPEGAEPTSYPRHVLARLVPRYNPALAGTNWASAFRAAYGEPGNIDDPSRWIHPEIPTLFAWVLTGVYGRDNPLIAVRNPYYWKIDPAGRQLPYIDQVEFTVLPDLDHMVEAVIARGVDMQHRHLWRAAHQILAARPDLRPLQVISTENNELIVGFNLTHADRFLREIFNQRDFRIALSLGIDRAKIVEDVAQGYGTAQPWQAAPLPQSRYYHARLATQYLEHDPDRANALLDALGYSRDAEGWRAGPGGRPIAFSIVVFSENRFSLLQHVVEDWRKLGIDATAQELSREDWVERVEANAFDAAAVIGDAGIDVLLIPDVFLPLTVNSVWGIPWRNWYLNPAAPNALEPPAPVRRQFALYDAIKSTTDPDAQRELMRQILDIAADQFYVIGTAHGDFETGIIRPNFRNVPLMFNSWVYPEPAPTNPAQFFIEANQ